MHIHVLPDRNKEVPVSASDFSTVVLHPVSLLGELSELDDSAPLVRANGYLARREQDGLAYDVQAGSLAGAQWLWMDMLQQSLPLACYELTLAEGPDGPTFRMTFGLLARCSARMRISAEALNQNRWGWPREGAWLKPCCAGDVVDLDRVTRIELRVIRKADTPVEWFQTALTFCGEEPDRIEAPVLPDGPLLDELGQWAHRDWPGKSRSAQDVTERLQGQARTVDQLAGPAGLSRWGGDATRSWDATGWFRAEQADGRWWLVDPDGHPFFSSGLDCVRANIQAAHTGLENALTWLPEPDGPFAEALEQTAHGPMVNYLGANFARAFGPEWQGQWASLAMGLLRRFGFNTVGNWSQWQVASAAGVPYVRPLQWQPERTPMVFRDFPDVFDDRFAEDVARFARQVDETADDPAMIGYFLMNEPKWGFAAQTPAAGLLLNSEPEFPARRELAAFLAARHGDGAGLARAWGSEITLADITSRKWSRPAPTSAAADLEAFSTAMVEKLFAALSAACKQRDPNHLNLGARYYIVPPAWALAGMGSFDVFSINCYADRIPTGDLARIADVTGRPTMIGEYHFGAIDVGLPGAGIVTVADQADRGQAFRFYLEQALTDPNCVGVHYFTMYDESALGRFDGENWNIGFVDICHRPYEDLVAAAQASHDRMYAVARGHVPAFNDPPKYLPRLFV